MKKIKFIVLILLLMLLLLILFYGIFGANLSYLSIKEIKTKRKLNNNLITHLKINNVDSIYEKNSNTFYYMVPSNFENKLYILNLKLENGFKYKIIGETLNVIRVNYNKDIDVIIYNEESYFETKIQLTNLPLINILCEDEITSEDSKTYFSYINNANIEKEINVNALMHIRGSSSKRFEKKSYKINFTNKSYSAEKDINMEKFYYGDALILDAVYRDPSKIRNLLSIELWNDISNDYNNVDVYSEFVELFINNEYIGLYVLTEPINKTKLKLKSTSLSDTSAIVKSIEWRTIKEVKENYFAKENQFLYYELKYPNDSDMYEKSWNVVLNKLARYYSNPNSYDVINEIFNINNYVDMIIFNAFTNNTDNQLKKNNYFYLKNLKNSPLFIQPWDMEYTFGMVYDSNNDKLSEKNMGDFNKIYVAFYHEDSPKINQLLIERYWDLRKNILTREYFDKLLNKYIYELNKGVSLRDSNEWYEYDVEKEIEEVRTWIYNRIEFFDEYVKELENE